MSAPAAVTVERSDAGALDELRPLWHALLDRHAEVWSVVPQRPEPESWERRRRQYEGWLADEGSFVLVARRAGAPAGYILVPVGESDETYATGEHLATIETLVVGHMDGNEAARRFYERRGFVPFVHLMYARRPGAETRGENA